jgi:hypothetical protein
MPWYSKAEHCPHVPEEVLHGIDVHFYCAPPESYKEDSFLFGKYSIGYSVTTLLQRLALAV